MPALDRLHETVKNALVKEGWTVTHDPLTLTLDGLKLFVDLGAERVLAAEKGARKIAVEIKTFPGPSRVADLQQALGQYVLYRIALRRIEPDRELYLAVPQDVLEDLFRKAAGEGFLHDEQGRVFGFDAGREEIVEWLP
jgi:hypothetical protein